MLSCALQSDPLNDGSSMDLYCASSGVERHTLSISLSPSLRIPFQRICVASSQSRCLLWQAQCNVLTSHMMGIMELL